MDVLRANQIGVCGPPPIWVHFSSLLCLYFPLPFPPQTRKELAVQLIYHKSGTASAAELAARPLATSGLLFQLSCQSLEPGVAMAHLCRAAGAVPCAGSQGGPSWQRVFASPAPASGTAGWEEASVSAYCLLIPSKFARWLLTY